MASVTLQSHARASFGENIFLKSVVDVAPLLWHIFSVENHLQQISLFARSSVYMHTILSFISCNDYVISKQECKACLTQLCHWMINQTQGACQQTFFPFLVNIRSAGSIWNKNLFRQSIMMGALIGLWCCFITFLIWGFDSPCFVHKQCQWLSLCSRFSYLFLLLLSLHTKNSEVFSKCISRQVFLPYVPLRTANLEAMVPVSPDITSV